jgi:lysozyme
MKFKGIDVSHYQGDIDWAKVKADGVQFAFIKATQGNGYKYVDYFRNQAPEALGHGVDVGAYHYGTFSTVPEAITEAKYFLSVVKDFKLTYPLGLDLEENKKGVSKEQLTDAAIAFLEVLEHAGYFAVFYSGKSFYESSLDEERLKPYALWIARYGDELGRNADIWQYSSEGKVDGIQGNVDLNWSYRDFAAEIKEIKPKPKVHIVIKGDSVSKIADIHHTTIKAIDKLNPKIKDLDLIYPGQKIRVK